MIDFITGFVLALVFAWCINKFKSKKASDVDFGQRDPVIGLWTTVTTESKLEPKIETKETFCVVTVTTPRNTFEKHEFVDYIEVKRGALFIVFSNSNETCYAPGEWLRYDLIENEDA